MADDRKRKDGGEPVLEFFWDSLELAADQTYSTTLRIKLTGWWEGGKPREVGVSVYEKGQEPPAGSAVRIQKGLGTFPLTGLLPGHHYLVITYIGERLPVQKMILVPELPKPKKPGEEELEAERVQFERAKIAHGIKEFTQPKTKLPRRLMVTISGERGHQKLLISISADDDSLAPGFVGSIQDGSVLDTYTTGENGIAIYETNFQESSRPFEIRAGNHPDLVWRTRLLGPRS